MTEPKPLKRVLIRKGVPAEHVSWQVALRWLSIKFFAEPINEFTLHLVWKNFSDFTGFTTFAKLEGGQIKMYCAELPHAEFTLGRAWTVHPSQRRPRVSTRP